MIPFDFDYYRPDTIDEAVQLYRSLSEQGKEPRYYGGGTEIITMARANSIYTGAVIDLKGIPECHALQIENDQLKIGSMATLSQIAESKLFPLMGKAVGRIADHTTQVKITLGGNLASTIIYRESALPLLLADGELLIAGLNGRRQVPVADVFHERLQLEPGEFVVQALVGQQYTTLPYVHVKKTRNEKIDYPLVSVVALCKDHAIRVGFSGLCSFPFRSPQIEADLNDSTTSHETRVQRALGHLPAPAQTDLSGSAQYRLFVLKNTLLNTLEVLEDVVSC